MKTSIKIEFDGRTKELKKEVSTLPQRKRDLIFSYSENREKWTIRTYFDLIDKVKREGFFQILILKSVKGSDNCFTPNFAYWCTCCLSDDKQKFILKAICNPLSGEYSEKVESFFLMPVIDSVYEQLKPEILDLTIPIKPEQQRIISN